MADVQEWVDVITKDVPEPLPSLVERQVQDVLQDFFRESEAWRQKDEYVVTVGQNLIELEASPADTYAVSLDWAFFTPTDGVRVKLSNELIENLDKNNSYDTSIVTACALSESGDSILLNSDGVEGVLEVKTVVQPKRTIVEIPEMLSDKWFDAIRLGAMHRLLMMPNKDWTNGRAAADYEVRYLIGRDKAKREARRDRSRPRRVAKFNRGFSW